MPLILQYRWSCVNVKRHISERLKEIQDIVLALKMRTQYIVSFNVPYRFQDFQDTFSWCQQFHERLDGCLALRPNTEASVYTWTHTKEEPRFFFRDFLRAVKRPQKLNLELSFETQSSHQCFSAVNMKLFELNSWRVEISFLLETRQLRNNGWNSSHNTRKTTHSPSLTSLYCPLVPLL
jgi:hypothetical protein